MKANFIFICLFTLPFVSNLLINLTPKNPIKCYTKTISYKDTLYFSFMVSSESTKEVFAELKNNNNNQIIHKVNNSFYEYKSKELLKGDYDLCFISKDSGELHVSFQYYSYLENGLINDLAKDQELKVMLDGVNEIKEIFQNFETNFKNIVDRRKKHNDILNDILSSIKYLTSIKVIILLLLSILQIYVIEKFFGPDKRIRNIKGIFSDKL